MMDTMKLLATASLILLARALPAADPNDDDFECLSSFHVYDSSSSAFEEQYTTEIISTREWVDVETDKDVPLTTLCDGRPRALESYKLIYTTTTDTLDPPETTTRYSSYTEPSPTCTIAETACTAIRSSFSSALSEYSTNDAPYPTDLPHCETKAPYVPCSLNPDYCFIYAGYEQTLYYWPVTTVSGDFCAQNGSTVFAEPTSPPEPNKAVIDGYTFTSPTNYLSYAGVSALLHGRRPQRTQCGTTEFKDVIVPITGDFYSRGYSGASASYTFNFGDLLPNPIPTSAYDRGRKCRFDGGCDTIVGSYTPILPLPTEIRDLDEEWKSVGCKGTADGYYITPVPLVTPAPTAKGGKLL